MPEWRNLLISAYKNVDDTDGIYGVMRDIGDANQQLLLLEHENKLGSALQTYNKRLSHDFQSG